MEYTHKQLSVADLALLKSLLALFGEAFGEPDTYQGAVPTDAYLEAQRPHRVVAFRAEVDDRAPWIAFEPSVGPTELAADRATEAAGAVPRQERKVGAARFGAEGAGRLGCAHLTSVSPARPAAEF